MQNEQPGEHRDWLKGRKNEQREKKAMRHGLPNVRKDWQKEQGDVPAGKKIWKNQ